MNHPLLRCTTLAGLAVVTALGLAACGGDDDPPARPSATESATNSPDSSPSASASPSPSEPSTPSVAPATGPLIETESFSVRVPEGYVYQPVARDLLQVANDPETLSNIYVSALKPYPDVSLDQLAEDNISASSRRPRQRRVADVELAGEPAFHLVGRPDSNGFSFDSYGLIYQNSSATIRFELRTLDAAQRQELIDSVLATWQWK